MNTDINLINIKASILKIIGEKLLVNTERFGDEFYNKDLLGSEVCFKARDLLRLYFEIEQQFNIRIPENDIISGKFNTVNNISSIVLKNIKF